MAYYINYIYKLIVNIKAGILCNTLFVYFLLLIPLSLRAQNQTEIQLAGEYLLKGEKNKAIQLYTELSKNEANIPFIHNNYFNAMLDLGMYNEALNYLKKISKKDDTNLQYQLDLGLLYVRSGELNKADRYFKEFISNNKSSIQNMKMMADYLTSKSLTSYATLCLIECRQVSGNPYLFSLELATLYRIQGQRDKMVQEYLGYVTQSSANTQYVKNVMQSLLTKPEELDILEKVLYEKIQQQPDVEVYADLLIWVNLQQKNFYASFVQARAFDKRYKKDGEKCMDVARVALDNADYENAAKIYRYVIHEFPSSPSYLMARLGLIHTREARVRNTFPVKKDSVKILVADYKKFIKQYPENNNALDAARNEALLFANYLDEKDSAIKILNVLVLNPRASSYLKSKSKLDLGDIYLTKGEPWESSLLYSQVEKMQKESVIGYEAKLKNAKLSYYRGDFRLAQEHLDILKQATTREIANDAMDLSIRIKENIAFDSAGEALKEYAFTELLLYQNKNEEALKKIEEIKKGIDGSGKAYSNQTILDDVYWLEANIRMKRGEFQEAISLLQKIQVEFPEDVLADDSYFLEGEIYERQLKNKEKAMELYRDFLNKYPGSVHAAEARKRFRQLRGDFDQTNP